LLTTKTWWQGNTIIVKNNSSISINIVGSHLFVCRIDATQYKMVKKLRKEENYVKTENYIIISY